MREGYHPDYAIHMRHVIECDPGSDLAASYVRMLRPLRLTDAQIDAELIAQGRLPLRRKRRPGRLRRWVMGAYAEPRRLR